MIAALLAVAVGVFAYQAFRVSSSIDHTSAQLPIRPPSPAEKKAAAERREKEAKAAIAALKAITSHDAARWHPIHFKPQIDTATNEQCLTCHQEILTSKVRERSPAGVEAAKAIAWYQTLDTYAGAQDTFHARHLTGDFARQVMNMKCSFCHQGSDPREQAPGASATAAQAGFNLRKTTNAAESCLLCHGQFPGKIMQIEDPWHKARRDFESAKAPNGCLVCHAEQFRTVRHKVNYLKAEGIEAAAKQSSDTCYGCHGGRAWYRTSYPYPRHPWPTMDKSSTPDWAKDRPTESRPEHLPDVN